MSKHEKDQDSKAKESVETKAETNESKKLDVNRRSASKSDSKVIENFKRNLRFIASHPKFSNVHAQAMKILSSDLSKDVDSEILKARLRKKNLEYLTRELEEIELGFLFFDGLDEKCIGQLC